MSGLSAVQPVKETRRRGRPLGSKTRPRETGTVCKPQLVQKEPLGLDYPHEMASPSTGDVPKSSVSAVLPETLTLIEQARHTFRRGNRFAGLVGFILGGYLPLATFEIVHREVAAQPLYWILVLGGLVYSAITVYKWAHQAFQFPLKAIGFVVLLEGTMTFSKIPWLGLTGLGILIALNGVSAAACLETPRKAKVCR